MSTRARFLPIAAAAAAVALIATADASSAETVDLSALGWRWPVDTVQVVEPFAAPAHAYGPGHRGVDLVWDGGAVRAPSGGIIAFAGPVAGRGVVTIDHGGGDPHRPTRRARPERFAGGGVEAVHAMVHR